MCIDDESVYLIVEWELPRGVLWEPAVASGGGAVWAGDL